MKDTSRIVEKKVQFGIVIIRDVVPAHPRLHASIAAFLRIEGEAAGHRV
jgi:hypothetical protein